MIHKQLLVFLIVMVLMIGGCFTTQPVSDVVPSGFLNLETVVGAEKAVQAIHGHREFEKLVLTLLVMRGLSNSLGA